MREQESLLARVPDADDERSEWDEDQLAAEEQAEVEAMTNRAAWVSPARYIDMEMDYTKKEIESVFRSHCNFSGLIAGIKRIKKGLSNACWQIDTGSGCFMLKVAVRKPSFELFQNVVEASRLVRQAGVRSPSILVCARDEILGGVPFMIQDLLPGCDAEDAIKAMDRCARQSFFREFARMAAVMHGVSGDKYGDVLQNHAMSSWPDLLLEILERRRKTNVESGILNREFIDLACSVLVKRIEQLVRGETPAITHRDLHLANVLLTDQNEIAFLDFEHVRFHDPLEDFVKLRLWVFSEYPDFERDFMSAYKQQIDWPDTAEDRIEVYSAFEYLAGIPYFAKYEKFVLPQYIEKLEKVIDEINKKQ